MQAHQPDQGSPQDSSVNIQLDQFYEFLVTFEKDKAEAKKARIRNFTQETVEFYQRYSEEILKYLPVQVKNMKVSEFRDKYQMNWNKAVDAFRLKPDLMEERPEKEERMDLALSPIKAPPKADQSISLQKNSLYSNIKEAQQDQPQDHSIVLAHTKQPYQSVQKRVPTKKHACMPKQVQSDNKTKVSRPRWNISQQKNSRAHSRQNKPSGRDALNCSVSSQKSAGSTLSMKKNRPWKP